MHHLYGFIFFEYLYVTDRIRRINRLDRTLFFRCIRGMYNVDWGCLRIHPLWVLTPRSARCGFMAETCGQMGSLVISSLASENTRRRLILQHDLYIQRKSCVFPKFESETATHSNRIGSSAFLDFYSVTFSVKAV